MTDMNQEEQQDSITDALSVTAIIAVVVGCVCFWLSGMPS